MFSKRFADLPVRERSGLGELSGFVFIPISRTPASLTPAYMGTQLQRQGAQKPIFIGNFYSNSRVTYMYLSEKSASYIEARQLHSNVRQTSSLQASSIAAVTWLIMVRDGQSIGSSVKRRLLLQIASKLLPNPSPKPATYQSIPCQQSALKSLCRRPHALSYPNQGGGEVTMRSEVRVLRSQQEDRWRVAVG